MSTAETHERWHPTEDDAFVQDAVERVNRDLAVGSTIERFADIIIACMRNAPSERVGARLAAYRVVDELRKALTSDAAIDAMYGRMEASSRKARTETVLRWMVGGAFDAVFDDDPQDDGGDAA